jgi:hypothetical protein
MEYGAGMVEQLPSTLKRVDPTFLGDPAAVEEILRSILAEAGTLDDAIPAEGDFEVAVVALS